MAKAVVGGLIAGLGALGTAWADGRMTPVEWVTAAGTALAAGYGVWQMPNSPPGEHR